MHEPVYVIIIVEYLDNYFKAGVREKSTFSALKQLLSGMDLWILITKSAKR